MPPRGGWPDDRQRANSAERAELAGECSRVQLALLGPRGELDLDRHASLTVHVRPGVPRALVAAQTKLHVRAAAQVPPPELALGPPDEDRETFFALQVHDRDRVPATTAPARHGDEGHA